jgi:hypothetical protein
VSFLSPILFLSIASRIRAGFGALVILTLLVGLPSVFLATRMQDQIAGLSDVGKQMGRTNAASQAFERLQMLETRYRLTGDRSTQEAMKAQLAVTTGLVSEVRANVAPGADRQTMADMETRLSQHGGRLERFVRLSRSSDAARTQLISVGDQLATASNELVAAPGADSPADQRYAAFLVDRKIQLMRLTSQQFMAGRDAERVRSFLLVAKSLETVIATAGPMLEEHASLLPPIANMIREFKTLFASWAESALEADRIYNMELRPEITDAVSVLATLDAQSNASFEAMRDAAMAESRFGTIVEAIATSSASCWRC